MASDPELLVSVARTNRIARGAADRFELWAELAELGMAIWKSNLDEEEIARRWEIWRREHDLSDREMLRVFREPS